MWHAFNGGNPSCTISYSFVGNGKATLDFRDCETKGVCGLVTVYLDGVEKASATCGENNKVSFDYNDGSQLTIVETGRGVIQINSFELGKFIIFYTFPPFLKSQLKSKWFWNYKMVGKKFIKTRM